MHDKGFTEKCMGGMRGSRFRTFSLKNIIMIKRALCWCPVIGLYIEAPSSWTLHTSSAFPLLPNRGHGFDIGPDGRTPKGLLHALTSRSLSNAFLHPYLGFRMSNAMLLLRGVLLQNQLKNAYVKQ